MSSGASTADRGCSPPIEVPIRWLDQPQLGDQGKDVLTNSSNGEIIPVGARLAVTATSIVATRYQLDQFGDQETILAANVPQ